jgi:hypothetical protein
LASFRPEADRADLGIYQANRAHDYADSAVRLFEGGQLTPVMISIKYNAKKIKEGKRWKIE